MNYWLAVGSPQNWNTAFEHGNIWGLKEKQRHLWENLREMDILLFYATKPVGGIIGYGPVSTKFKQNNPLWPMEVKERTVIWPLRFEFDVTFCLSPDKWLDEKLVSRVLFPRAGFQLLSPDIGEKLISGIGTFQYDGGEVRRESSMISESLSSYTGMVKEVKDITPHDQIKKTLIQIGKLQKFICQEEYPFDLGRLDVVWRRVEQSVPTYVFEVQVGGNIYQALAKLKHAFDLWNSHIYIVAAKEDNHKVNSLLSGTFHEIRNRIRFIELERVEELYERKKAYFDLEKELGI